MVTTAGSSRIIDAEDAADVARSASTYIAGCLAQGVEGRGRASIALSGGNTPREAYALLAREPGVDWSKVAVFWVDERAVPPTDDRSNYRWAKATLLDSAPISVAQVHRMRADASDLDAAAKEYEALIAQHVPTDGDGVPTFDVLVMGVGDDAHTASLFPHDPAVTVTDRFVVAVPASTGREARLTLTAPVIQHARSIAVLVVGTGKHAPLEHAWAAEGDIRDAPIRILRGCRGSVAWIVDKAARQGG